MMQMSRLIFIMFLFSLSIQGIANYRDTLFVPQIEGTIRAKYEYAPESGEHRFQVRNARFSVNGNLSKITSYKAEIDLSDEGVTKMLDAFIRIKPLEKLIITMGQQKVPFSTDNLRSPHQLYFANRSFIGKQLTALRDVGFTAEYDVFKEMDVFFGIYNGTGLYNQKQWRLTDELSFVARTVIRPLKNLKVSVNYNTIKPTFLRMDMIDAGIMLDVKNWHLESEYFFKTYRDTILASTKGFYGFVAFDIKTPELGSIKKITPLIRYDIMTENIRFDDSGILKKDPDNERITAGLTFRLGKPFLNDIRINYEQYFNEINIPDNKLVVEFTARF
jgi:hypothetical protein